MKIDRVGAILDLFTHAYFSFLPTTNRAWSKVSDMINLYWELSQDPGKMVELQEAMVRSLAAHPSSRYPVSGYHKAAAAEWLAEVAREGGWELCQELREDLSLRQCEMCQFVLRTHNMADRMIWLLEEQRDQLTRGSTGLVSWQGASALLDWAVWSGLLTGKRVLELGSGLGQFGLTAIKTLSLSHLTMTDFHHNVINALDFHVNLNLNTDFDAGKLEDGYPRKFDEDSVRGIQLEYKELSLSVQQLDWRSYDLSRIPPVDIVVASDIVFARELHAPLSRLLSDLLEVLQAEQPAVYIACTVRSDGMVKGFLSILETFNIKAEIVYDKSYSPEDGLISSHELLHPIKVLKISRDTEKKSGQLSDMIFF